MNSFKPGFEILNGKLQEAGSPVFSGDNRAFRYGDGLFETICVRNGNPLFIQDHWNRLTRGLKILSIPMAEGLDIHKLKLAIDLLLQKHELTHARLRLIAYREADGMYAPSNAKSSWLLSVTGKVEPLYQINMPGLSADVFESDFKTSGALSNLKTLNALLFVCAGLEASEKGFDEMLIRNHKGHMIESVKANLFIRQGTIFKTPPLSEGCLDGVMRKQVIQMLKQRNLEVLEVPLQLEDVMSSEELILTNVIQGAKWIENFRGKKYGNQYACLINGWLNEMLGHRS